MSFDRSERNSRDKGVADTCLLLVVLVVVLYVANFIPNAKFFQKISGNCKWLDFYFSFQIFLVNTRPMSSFVLWHRSLLAYILEQVTVSTVFAGLDI